MNNKIPEIIITEDEVRTVLQGYYRGFTLSNSNSTSLHQKSVEAHSFDFFTQSFLLFLRLLSLSAKF